MQNLQSEKKCQKKKNAQFRYPLNFEIKTYIYDYRLFT